MIATVGWKQIKGMHVTQQPCAVIPRSMFHCLLQFWKWSGWSVIEGWSKMQLRSGSVAYGFVAYVILNSYSTASNWDVLICKVLQGSSWGSASRCLSAWCDLAEERCAEYSFTLTISAMIIFPVVFNYVFHSSKNHLEVEGLGDNLPMHFFFHWTRKEKKKKISSVDHYKFLEINSTFHGSTGSQIWEDFLACLFCLHLVKIQISKSSLCCSELYILVL